MFRNGDKIYSCYLLSEYKKIDYLNENISECNYDWNVFHNFVEKSGHIELLESFDLISSHKTVENEIKHIYEIKTLNNLKFEVHLTYSDPVDSFDLANKRELTYNHKKQNTLANNYSVLKNILKTNNGSICMVMFKDIQGSTNITNQVGLVSGLELFRTLNDVSRDSTNHIINNGGEVSCIGLRIWNNEKQKRLKFYKMLHQKYWSSFFPNSFVDENSEKEHGYTLIYFYK